MPLPHYYREQDTPDFVLRRFLSLFGDQLQLMQALLDKFPDITNVLETEVRYLTYMASEVGVTTAHRDDEGFRYDIRFAVPFYAKKGTKSGLCEFVRRETGWACLVVEGMDDLFCLSNNPPDDITNDLSCTTLDFTTGINPNSVIVYLFGTNADPFWPAKIARLNRDVRKYVPPNAQVIFHRVN